MANLVVDIGNTFTKLALFEGDELISINQFAGEDINQITQFISRLSAQKAIVSSVKKRKSSMAIGFSRKHAGGIFWQEYGGWRE